MSHEVFGQLLDELEGDGANVLKVKNGRYSAPDDALHNFRAGANFTGLTPAQTCWGYMSKHLIALKDMVDRNDFSNREDFLEKCKDPINYLRILWAIGNDEEYWKNQDRPIAGEIDASCLKGNKIGSSERMWQDITVYRNDIPKDAPDEVVYHYTLAHEAQVEDFGHYFEVYYVDIEGCDASATYPSDKYYYKINNRKDK